MSAQGESLMEVTRHCMWAASRVNPESPHRKMLRQLLRWNELEVGEALLFLDRLASEPETFALAVNAPAVREARHVLHPFYEARPS